MKQMLMNTLSLAGVVLQFFSTAVKERLSLSIQKIIFGISVMVLVFFAGYSGFAQCSAAGSVTTTITTTPNTCAGNGTIKATFSSATSIAIQLIKGGTIIQSVNNPVSPYTFSNLQAGTNYEVKTVCGNNNSIVYSDNANITVAENYVDISDANVAVSNLCTNFTTGGTLTVNGVTGGTAPYQYSVILSNDPAYSDASSIYSTSNTKNVTAFGTYQIRIKDACGNYKTFTKTLTPTLEAIRFYWRSRKICAPNSPKKAEMYAWYGVSATTGSSVSINDYLNPGIKLVIRDTDASGAILFNGTYTGTPIPYIESATHNYYITTTNACGLSTSYTHSLSAVDANPEFNDFTATSGNSGCGAAETMSISASFIEQFYWRFPVTVVIKNAGGTQVGAPVTGIDFMGSANFSNLPFGTYTVTATDQCGESLTKTVTSPVSSGTAALSLKQITNWRCDPLQPLVATGTLQAMVEISGYLPDRANAVVKIVSGPSNVGVVAKLIDGLYYGWTNLAPGTYSVSVKSCGVEKFYPLTISSTDFNILQQSLTSTAVSFCSGGGNVSSNKVYNGAYENTVELLNLSGLVVASHVLGNFTNIPAGTYTTRIKIVACGNVIYYVPGSTVTLTNSSTGPKITSSTGVICENAAGTPLTTGSAYLNLAGVAPFIVQYRVQGSSAAYTVINTSNSSLQIDNLVANTTYEVNLKDACGGNFPTTVQIKTVGVLSTNNNAQPCIGSPYTLSMPEYAGATYQWINSAGTVLSNTRFYEFASYLAANDGVYTCKISWGNCVTRLATVALNSALCGQPIGVCGTIDTDQDGIFDFCDLDDDNDGILDANECGPVEKVVNGFNGPGVSFTGWTRDSNPNGWVASSGIAIESSYDGPGVHTIKQTVNGLIPGKTYALTFDAFALGLTNTNPNTLSVTIDGISYYSKTAGVDINFAVQGESIGFTPTGTSVTIEFISTVTGTLGSTGRDVFVRKVSIINCEKDTDNDGKPDYLDLDSDGDGCPDAIEGTENVTKAQLNPNGSINIGTTGGVNGNGVPNLVNTGGTADNGSNTIGQSLGNSANVNLKDPACYNLVLNADDYQGITGVAFTTANILVNDLLDNVVPVIGTTPGLVTISQSGIWPAGITLNTTTGAITIANTVPGGVYVVNYQACVNGTSPSLCQTQIITITLCGKLPLAGTPDTYTKTGISNLEGFANGWPGNVPNGFIAIESKNKGFVITRVSSSAAILSPIEGMLIYDIAASCIKLYNGTIWNCLQKSCN